MDIFSGLSFVLVPLLALLSFGLWSALRRHKRTKYIRTFKLPPGLLDKLSKLHPDLARKDLELIDRGLRQFFLAYLWSGHKYVAMPSQVADDLWHEFILYTRAYKAFCDAAFGKFLHHTPAVALAPSRKESNAGLRRVWYWACKDELIDPRNPSRLPLLFALDAKLKIKNGFHYTPDCSALRQGGGADGSSAAYCGGDFSSTSVDGSTDGFGDGDSGAGDGGGDGGGCGGGGD